VRYLLALDVAYCVECGTQVTLYSRADLTALLKGPASSKPVRLRRLEANGEPDEASAQSA
jgi:hypothetical protein